MMGRYDKVDCSVGDGGNDVVRSKGSNTEQRKEGGHGAAGKSQGMVGQCRGGSGL